LNITLWSYCQNVNLCILANAKVLPDGWRLFNDFVQELDTLEALIPDRETKQNASQEAAKEV
jgi:Tfp pilus assembly protein PilO